MPPNIPLSKLIYDPIFKLGLIKVVRLSVVLRTNSMDANYRSLKCPDMSNNFILLFTFLNLNHEDH